MPTVHDLAAVECEDGEGHKAHGEELRGGYERDRGGRIPSSLGGGEVD